MTVILRHCGMSIAALRGADSRARRRPAGGSGQARCRRSCPERRRVRSVCARNAAELTIEALNAGSLPPPYDKKGHERTADRDGHRGRGRGHHQAGYRVPQSRRATEGRRDHWLYLVGRLPRDRAARRRAQGADDILRLRHPAHLRGQELQVSVPHRRARRHGQRRGGPLPARSQQGHKDDRRDQSELCLGTRFLERLQGLDADAQPRREDRDRAVSQAARRTIRSGDLGTSGGEAGCRPFELLGRRHGGVHLARQGARRVRRPHRRDDGRRAGHVPHGAADPRRHGDRRARPTGCSRPTMR